MSILNRLSELVFHNRRRLWQKGSRSYFEIRDINAREAEAFSRYIRWDLQRRNGVHWARVNTALRRVIVSHDSLVISCDEIDAIICAIEIESNLYEKRFLSPSSFPGYPEPVVRSKIEMAADAMGMLTGFTLSVATPRFVSGRFQVSAIDISAGITALQNLPVLRDPMEKSIGVGNTDLMLSLFSTFSEAALNGWSGSAIDILQRYHKLKLDQARYLKWEEWEPVLCANPEHHIDSWNFLRPPNEFCELKGPIEHYSDMATQMSLGAMGYGLVTSHNLERAAASLFSTVPKPAMMGRDAFVCALARQFLASGVLVLNPYALENLDKINCVVIEGNLLRAKQGVISYIHRLVDMPIGRVSGLIESLFNERTPFTNQESKDHTLEITGFDQLPEDLQSLLKEQLEDVNKMQFALVKERSGQCSPIAIVGIQAVLETAAEILVKRVADARLKLAVLDHNEEYFAWASPDFCISKDNALKEITILKERGFGVAVIAEGYCEAFSVSDIGLGLVDSYHSDTPPWGADLISAEGMSTSWLLLESIFAARKNAGHCVELSKIDAFSGLILSITNLQPRTIKRIKFASNLVSLAAMVNGMRLVAQMPAYPSHADRDPTPWHAMPVATVLQKLESGESGLQPDQIEPRYHRDVPVVQPPVEQFARMLVDELANPLAPILAAGAGLSAVTGAVMDSLMIGAVVLLNGAIGAAQRYQTEQALHQLDDNERPKVRVIREGSCEHREQLSLVEGDVIELEAGEVVPGDCRLIDAWDLELDESSLTGESLPVRKKTQPSYASSVADRHSMIFEGTTIAAGRARAVVVALDKKTEANKSSVIGLSTPQAGVEVRLNQLTEYTAPVAALSGIALMASGLSRNLPAAEVISSGVSLAVAAVPEGLPLLATMAQLGSAKRLSTLGALVRNPRAIESLGRMDVLCADKTGTLTEGKLKVRLISNGTDTWESSAGTIPDDGKSILAKAYLAGPDGNDARIPHMTDRAVIEGAREFQVGGMALCAQWQRVTEIPFKSENSFHAVLGQLDGQRHIMVKGAPDVLIDRCDYWWHQGQVAEISAKEKSGLAAHAHELAEKGLRVLAVTERRVRSDKQNLKPDDIQKMVFVGMIAISDAVRPAAREAVGKLTRIGVDVKMITGDHPKTASAIAEQLGLPQYRGVLTGPQIDAMSDNELEGLMNSVSVFARVTPSQKARIVGVLQSARRVVGMTGDGSNDAPAIRLADVGIALGENATSSARAASDLLVVDGRIETIVAAVLEGRALWASVKDSVSLLVGGNLGEIGFSLLGGLIGGASPLNARQLLLVNLLTDTLPALSVALRRNSRDELVALAQQKPDEVLGKDLVRDIQIRAAVTTGASTVAWLIARMGGRQGANTVSMLTLVGSQLVQTLQMSKGSKTVIATSVGSLAALLGIVQTPGISQFFGCRPLGPLGLLQATSVTAGAAVLHTMIPGWLSRISDQHQQQLIKLRQQYPLYLGENSPEAEQKETEQETESLSGEASR